MPRVLYYRVSWIAAVALLVLVASTVAMATESSHSSENADDTAAVIEDAYRAIASAADVLLAHGNDLSGVKALVEYKRSEAKTKHFNQKIRAMLGEESKIAVEFVRYGYAETRLGDDEHFLVWDLCGTDATASSPEDAAAAAAPSFRFSMTDDDPVRIWTLPGDRETLEFSRFGGIEHKRDYETVQYWFVPDYDRILHDVEVKASLRDLRGASEEDERDRLARQQAAMRKHFEAEQAGTIPSPSGEDESSKTPTTTTADSQEPPAKPQKPPKRAVPSLRELYNSGALSVENTLKSFETNREASERTARERYEQEKAQHPAFSFRTALPELFADMSAATGATEDDLERALAAIRTLAHTRETILFRDIFSETSCPGQN